MHFCPKQLRAFACALCISLVGSGAVRAQDTVEWGEVGGWLVAIDKTVAGCFALGAFDRGTYFRIGIDPQHANGYVVIGNDAWQSIEVGKDYPLDIQFGESTPWVVDARAIRMSDSVGLIFAFSGPDLAVDFMRKQNVLIRYKGVLVSDISLKGSYAAFMEVMRCQDAVDGRSVAKSADPFASTQDVSDPFAE
jgi:hypothetical protein